MTATFPMAYVSAPGTIQFVEKAVAEVEPHSVLVNIKVASICGSDLHLFRGKHPRATLPVAVGHEASGVVVAVGKEVTKIREGDRVTVEPVVVCGECGSCRRGAYSYCERFTRPYRLGQGSFAPYLMADEKWTHKLPAEVSFEEGCLVEPLAVAVHAIKRGNVRLGHSVAIFGAGAIGLLALQVAKLSGVGQTIVVDLKEFRLAEARRWGATFALNASLEDAVKYIHDQTDGLGVDRAFEAAGAPATLEQCLHVLKKGGTGVILGLFEEQHVPLPVNLITSNEISLVGSLGYCWDFQDALRLLEMRAVNPRLLVTHTFPLSQLQTAFELLLAPGSQAMKVLIQTS